MHIGSIWCSSPNSNVLRAVSCAKQYKFFIFRSGVSKATPQICTIGVELNFCCSTAPLHLKNPLPFYFLVYLHRNSIELPLPIPSPPILSPPPSSFKRPAVVAAPVSVSMATGGSRVASAAVGGDGGRRRAAVVAAGRERGGGRHAVARAAGDSGGVVRLRPGS